MVEWVVVVAGRPEAEREVAERTDRRPVSTDGMDGQPMRSYFSCLIMALLLRPPDSTPGNFAYQGEVDINGAKADSLKITTKDGLIISLAIDQQTHRPIMAGYSAPMQDTAVGSVQARAIM